MRFFLVMLVNYFLLEVSFETNGEQNMLSYGHKGSFA